MVRLTRKKSYKRRLRNKSRRQLQRAGNPVKPHKFVVLAMFKNEGMGIREWIEHYLWQGVDAFLMLDNNSTDNWKEAIKGLEDKVTVLPAPEKGKQKDQYNSIGMPWLKANGVTILGIFDMDEFVFVKDGRKLKDRVIEIFEAEPKPSQLLCKWTMFGSSGFEKQPESIRKSFTWKGKDLHQNTKAIMRLDKVKENGLDLHSSSVDGPTIDCPADIQLNHYTIQSKEFFEKVKMTRGAADRLDGDKIRNWNYFKDYDVKDVEDTQLRDLLLKEQKGGRRRFFKQNGGDTKSIFCQLCGGLGNQIYRYAAALAVQKFIDMPIYVYFMNDNPHSSVDYKPFFKKATPINLSDMKQRIDNAISLPEKIGPNEPEFMNKIAEYKKTDIKINKYYHSYSLVKDVIPIIKTDFMNELKVRYPDFEAKIINGIPKESILFMHVRKGDYNSAGWGSPTEYYTSALEIIDTVPDIKIIYILSNNIDYCKEQIKNNVWKTSKEIKIFDEPDELKCMYLMSLCKGGAILSTASTFSFWGAMFGPDENNSSVIIYSKDKNINPEQIGNKWRSISEMKGGARYTRKVIRKIRGGQQPLKVAILFSGRITAYDKVLNKLQDLKNNYNPVCYCSLNEPEYNDYIDKFCKIFDITRDRVNLEPTPYPDFLNNLHGNNPEFKPKNMYSMFYHQNKAFNMMEKDITNNNKQFDCIVYYRADIDSPDKLILEMPKPNTIYIPNGHDYGGINDRFAYGNFESMKKYCNLLNTITSAESISNIGNPEQILKRYLNTKSLEIQRFKFDTCLNPYRSDKNISLR
jgi:hypothetical protein